MDARLSFKFLAGCWQWLKVGGDAELFWRKKKAEENEVAVLISELERELGRRRGEKGVW